MSTKCSVQHCAWEAHPLYFHPKYGGLCENHYVDLAWLVMYAFGKKQVPKYPEPGRETEVDPYYLANSCSDKVVTEVFIPDDVQRLLDLGWKKCDIPRSKRDREYLLSLI